jgi:hypothetical protein
MNLYLKNIKDHKLRIIYKSYDNNRYYYRCINCDFICDNSYIDKFLDGMPTCNEYILENIIT